MTRHATIYGAIAAVLAAAASAGACANESDSLGAFGPNDDGGVESGSDAIPTGFRDGMADGNGPAIVGDPKTCAEAEMAHTYVGCDYWPTVTANPVWSVFDFAVAVTNAGTTTGTATITGPGGFTQTLAVVPGQAATFYLPWVKDLKGPDQDNCAAISGLTASVDSKRGAYHLVSTVPVIAYQFNALEYASKKLDGTPTGPPGKDWSSCPGYTTCSQSMVAIGCNSFTNDASLLIPTPALTGNYRVMGSTGWSEGGLWTHAANDGGLGITGASFTITATQDGTSVKAKLGPASSTLAGGQVPALGPGDILTLTMNAGDVVEVVSPLGDTHDFSGTVINATAPVMVIAGTSCLAVPEGYHACDHLESVLPPAEALGKDYFVPATLDSFGTASSHVVRFYGNVDDTHLTYEGTPPPGAPTTLNAGQMVDIGSITPTITPGLVTTDFRVKGDQPFGMGTQMPSAGVHFAGIGDPSQSFFASAEQFRKKYVFLAPDDYNISLAEIVSPDAAKLTLDGAPAMGTSTPMGDGYSVTWVRLDNPDGGASVTGGVHTLESDMPVGLQIIGYGQYTSYQYPAGLNLSLIAPPPQVN